MKKLLGLAVFLTLVLTLMFVVEKPVEVSALGPFTEFVKIVEVKDVDGEWVCTIYRDSDSDFTGIASISRGGLCSDSHIYDSKEANVSTAYSVYNGNDSTTELTWFEKGGSTEYTVEKRVRVVSFEYTI